MEANIEMQENVLSLKNEKSQMGKYYTIIGFALFVMSVLYIVIQSIAGGIISGYLDAAGKKLMEISWLKWVLTFAPLYLIAMPISVAIMKKVPAKRQDKVKLGTKNFIIFLLMLEGIMTVGNTLGNIVAYLITGGTASNGLLDYSMDSSLYKILFMCILAPFLEEYIFRKQIIDRCSKYGEGEAIIFSALTFALFHMNIYQFFYAFGIGIILAYVYTRTRDMKYNVTMHMIINFIGSVLAPWIISKVDMDLINQISSGNFDKNSINDSLNGIILYFAYMILIIGISIVGIVLLVIKRNQFVVNETSEHIKKGERIRNIYLNIGFLLFLIFCVGITTMNLIN